MEDWHRIQTPFHGLRLPVDWTYAFFQLLAPPRYSCMLDYMRERGSRVRNGGTSRDSPPYRDRLRTRHSGEHRCSSLGCRRLCGTKKGGKAAGVEIFDGQLGQMTASRGAEPGRAGIPSTRLIKLEGLKAVDNPW